jgi:hypothetical protein
MCSSVLKRHSVIQARQRALVAGHATSAIHVRPSHAQNTTSNIPRDSVRPRQGIGSRPRQRRVVLLFTQRPQMRGPGSCCCSHSGRR